MFSKAEENDIVFEGSVGSPDPLSDEFIPIILSISRMGAISMKRATIIDAGNDSYEEEGV